MSLYSLSRGVLIFLGDPASSGQHDDNRCSSSCNKCAELDTGLSHGREGFDEVHDVSLNAMRIPVHGIVHW